MVGEKKKESKHEMSLRTQGAGKVAETISNNLTKSNESSVKHQVEILSKYVDVVNSSTCGASNANGESNMSGDSNASDNTSGRDSTTRVWTVSSLAWRTRAIERWNRYHIGGVVVVG